MATESIYKETLEALTRLQQFDANTLSREVDLGTQMNFAAAVDPAREIIGVYLRIPSATLKVAWMMFSTFRPVAANV